MNRPAPTRRKCATVIAALLIAGGLSASRPARADYAVPALGSWIAQSDTVAFAAVAAITEGVPTGGFTLQLAIDEVLVGTQRTNWSVPGSDAFSDDVPRLPVGTIVLAFVPPTPQAGGYSEGRVIPLPESSKAEARTVIQTVVTKGAALRLADVSDRLRSSTAELGAPLVLLGMLLEELTLRVTTDEATGIAGIACTTDASFRKDAQLWAVARAGELRVAGARSCLEMMVGASDVRDFAIAAADALGDLGARESVTALLGLLPATQRDPKVKARHAKSDVLVGAGSSNEPEDESNPVPDTGESPGESTDSYDGSAAGGATSPEDPELAGDPAKGARPDASRRTGDGGLAVTAVLSLGKIGDPLAVPFLARIAKEGDNLALHSSVVSALGMIGDKRAIAALESIAKRHPNPLVRTQAAETLSRLS
ncbi:MAG: HEAT repeat domain-containing protein [Deltaproteobacteria bacterium]|nr:HEAT repeat domain-containing protein [Deltaproteobacteria bacterium]